VAVSTKQQQLATGTATSRNINNIQQQQQLTDITSSHQMQSTESQFTFKQ
jgi:hypothetical protein